MVVSPIKIVAAFEHGDIAAAVVCRGEVELMFDDSTPSTVVFSMLTYIQIRESCTRELLGSNVSVENPCRTDTNQTC